MSMNKNNNTYILLYSTVMVVIVAILLAVASLTLKSRQEANIAVEKQSAILASIGLGGDADKAENKTRYIENEYKKYIVESFAVNGAGEKIADADAFGLLSNLKNEYEKPASERMLPVFVAQLENGTRLYVLPVWGTGLWGPIWGYVALEGDWDTIYGVKFDHKGETPGLGAEISTAHFADQFAGKHIFNDGQMVSIAVLKGAGASAGDINAVDAVSGGTITSRGVESMLKECLSDYLPYIEKQKAAAQTVISNETNNSENNE